MIKEGKTLQQILDTCPKEHTLIHELWAKLKKPKKVKAKTKDDGIVM